MTTQESMRARGWETLSLSLWFVAQDHALGIGDQIPQHPGQQFSNFDVCIASDIEFRLNKRREGSDSDQCMRPAGVGL